MLLVVCGLFILGGFALKAQCHDRSQGREYGLLCYNDLQTLYEPRGISEDKFPYVDGALIERYQGGRFVGPELVGGAIEYPVLTGLFMWFSGLFADSSAGYVVASAVLLAPFGLLTAHLLGKLAGSRAYLWAAAPALVLYSFHNWDLLVAAAAVGGFLAWSRGKSVLAAVLFGIGGALKVFPLFFLAPLALERLRRGQRNDALVIVAAGAGVFALINLPFVLVNFEGWWATYEFHQTRRPFLSDNSIWVWGFQNPPMTAERMNLLSTVLIGASFLVALGVGWWRSRATKVYPVLQVSAALVTAFLLWSKVHSPQYALWILPFFVLLRIPLVLWALYSLADLLLYVGTFRWFYDLCLGRTNCVPQDDTIAKDALLSGLWGRAALLVVLFGVFLWARSAVGADEDGPGARRTTAPA